MMTPRALRSERRVEKSANVAILAMVWVGSLISIGSFIACGGESSAVGSAKLPSGSRSSTVDHEACDESGRRVDKLDANNDGKLDLRRVFDTKSNRELCRIADLNYDGKPDLFEYFDGSGQIRRREFSYDDTGIVNAIEFYEGGKLVRREYDTTGQHRVDTWDFFDPNRAADAKTQRAYPARRERDTTGDGLVDQWWTWETDKLTIAFDRTGDGKPDPDSLLVLSPNGDPLPTAAPTPPPAPAASSDPASDGGAPSANPAPSASTASAPPAAPASASAGDAGAGASSTGSKGGAK